MKTDHFEQRFREMVDGFLDCELMKEAVVEIGLCNNIRTIIAEIQRDARKGMVPVETVMELVKDAEAVSDRQLCAPYTFMGLLRAKHPELFTT